MKKLFTVFILSLGVLQANAQIKWLPRFINKMYFDKDSTRHSSFVVLPVLSSAPETGLEIGGAGLYSFYSDTLKKSITKVSNVYGYASVTTKGQSRFSLSTTYFSPQNQWHVYSAVSYIHFPFNFYGIGNSTRKADGELVDEKRFRFNIDAEKLVTKNLYVGAVAGGFNYKYTNADPTSSLFETDPQVQDRSGGANVFFGPSLIFDTRDNNTYTSKGAIITAYYNLMHGILSNNNYISGFLNIEYSQFFKLSKKLILGVDIQEQSLTGGRSPFYLLPTLGSDEMMRGYYNGRYRDRNFIAGQTELRYRITERIGIVGFLGAGEVAHGDFSINTLKPNYGGGLRYFFDTEKGLSIRADYGIGEKVQGEARQSGFYIGLGQAF
ncbi:BamA/TamA family outer membrane protein [Mucilaginibacter sp. BT774]|uniref:BamA/TamA family outer membrane protein n=1 Tax=Mucilaginibacter sp. BT774 TaxID=3062276 RepID=UPI002675A6A7|nr:BamA/TamA family outer membrane protein [Mucilaginibacter sp. BT774]MDO3626905.1 polymerase [Mucilaginibacter sp. BT774]